MEELAAPWGACLPDKQLLDGRLCQGAAFLVLLCQVLTRESLRFWSVLRTASPPLFQCALEVEELFLCNARLKASNFYTSRASGTLSNAGTALQQAKELRAAAGLSSASELMRLASAAALTVAWSQPRRMLAASSCALDAAIRQPRKVLEASLEASNSALDAACDVAWRAPARKVMEASNAALSAACRQPRRVLHASNAALGWGFGLLPLQARPVLGASLPARGKTLRERKLGARGSPAVCFTTPHVARVQCLAGLRVQL